MRRLPTAAALALLLVTAGVASVVSADPNGTDARPTQANVTDVAPATDGPGVVDIVDATTDRRPGPFVVEKRAPDVDGPTFEHRLDRRLAHFDLTDAQVREIVTEASRLKEAGASRLVIRSSIVMHLYEFGVDAPFLHAGDGADRPADAHAKLHRYIASLDITPQQARQLHSMVHRMYDGGASRAEIRRAVQRQLAAWDVDARPDGGRPDAVDRLVDRLADRHGLTDRQAAEVERLIRRMLDSGAHRGEIREAVGRLVDSYADEASTRDDDRPTAADRVTRIPR